MKIRNISWILLLIFNISSCQKAKEDEVFEKVFLNEQSSNPDIKDYFQKMELVEMIFDDNEKWIGNIDLYKISLDHLYLLDESQGKKIVKFDLQGNFVLEINSVGDSPDGFNKPSLFSIDESKNEMIVIDRSQFKIFYYDLEFNLLKSEKLEHYLSNISHLNNDEGFLIFPDDVIKESKGYVLAYKDYNGIIESILHTKHQIIPHLSEHLFYNNYSGFYHLPFEDKIYRYNSESNNFHPLFQVMLNTEEIPTKMLNSTDILAIQSYVLENQRKFVSFNGIEFRNQYFLFYHNNLESYNFARIDKSDFTDNISVSWSGLVQDTNLPVPFGSGDGFYYSVGYLSKQDYENATHAFGIQKNDIDFPDFKEKLFLMKYYLK